VYIKISTSKLTVNHLFNQISVTFCLIVFDEKIEFSCYMCRIVALYALIWAQQECPCTTKSHTL